MQKTTLAYALSPALMIAALILPHNPAAAGELRRSQSVSISDLDLATPEGQRRLDARIRRVARSVCDVDTFRTGSHVPAPEALECYREALRNARERVVQAVANRTPGG